MNPKEIIEGWKNTLFTDEQIEELAAFRLSICNSCIHKKKVMKMDVCGLCRCPLIAKSRSPESVCPKGYWEKDKTK